MADYYTHLSMAVELPSKQAAEQAVALLATIEEHLEGKFDADGDEEAPWPEELVVFKQYEFSAGLHVEVEGDGIWIRDDGGGPNIDLLADYLQLVLKKFNPEGSAGFEWSSNASKHLLDAFGGGSVFVTADSIDWCSTWQWLNEKEKAWQNGKSKDQAATA
jgi:hypothetical protein